MLGDSLSHAREDMELRRLREEQVEADRVLEALRAALAVDGDRILSAEEREVIEAAASELAEARDGADYRAIKAAIGAVEQASGEYVARRMNESIRKAMAGHRVDEFNSS
jgi:molecular chaperone HscA